jgi:hypothetical protein
MKEDLWRSHPKENTDPRTTFLEFDDTVRDSDECDDGFDSHDNLQLPSRPLKSRGNASLVLGSLERVGQVEYLMNLRNVPNFLQY